MKNCILNDNCKKVLTYLYETYPRSGAGFSAQDLVDLPLELSPKQDVVEYIYEILMIFADKNYTRRMSQMGVDSAYILLPEGRAVVRDDLLDEEFKS